MALNPGTRLGPFEILNKSPAASFTPYATELIPGRANEADAKRQHGSPETKRARIGEIAGAPARAIHRHTGESLASSTYRSMTSERIR